MKEVIIKSKIVGKEGSIGSGKPIAFPDLSAYALRSDFIRLESSFNDFLEGDDTDNVINRWKELEAFLNNISEDYNLLSLLNGKADKATTLSGYGITDAYTKTNVDDLLRSYVTLGGTPQTITGEKNFTGGLKVNGSLIYYDTDKKYWKLEGDLLVTGGVTMYGSDSSFTPSTIMDALLYDDATLGINSEGKLYVKGGTSGGGLDITALQNYLTQNSYLNVTSGDNRYLKLSGGMINGENGQVPLTISNTASTLRIGFLRNNEVLGFLGFIEANKPLFYDKDGNGRLLLHERNYSSYALPLSGGTINGDLFIANNYGGLVFSNTSNNSNAFLFYNGNADWYVTNKDWGAGYKIWHEGNFTPSNYLPLSGGTMTGNILLGGTTTNKIGTNIVDTTSWQEFTHQNSHGYIAIGPFNDSVAHIYTDRPSFYFNKELYVNSAKVWNAGNDGSGSTLDADLLDGKHLSDILASNVASATKLQTARTIWGQSFDGTGNVDGKILLTSWDNDGIGLRFQNSTKGVAYISMYAADGNAYIFGQNGNRFLINHNVYGDIFNVLGDNVSIGTVLNVGFKLAVNGDSVTNNIRTQSIMLGYSDVSSSQVSNRRYYASITYENEGQSPSYLNPALVFKTMNNTYQSGTEVERMRLCSNGNLSVGYAGNKGTKLYVDGNVLASGGITMYSDQRKKTILNHVELSLKDIADAPLIEHYYNSDEKKTTHVGSIAQYWANMNDWFCKLDSEGYYTMEIQNAALASAISVARELVKFENETDKRIRLLVEENKELRNEIERLKAS